MSSTISPEVATPTPDDRRKVWRDGMLIAVVALTLNLIGNTHTGLWDRDEPRYAVAVREMRSQGDWMLPTFNGEPRYHKPILIYWLMGASTAVFGDNPFGLRFVSACAGVATALVCWRLARQLVGPLPALLGTLALVTSPLMVAESKLATTDATLALTIATAQACLWSLSQRDSMRVALGFWAAVAIAFLTKGPVGPSLIAVAGLASWLFGGPTAYWRRLRWRWGFGLFLMITVPWFLYIGIRTQGDFFRFAVGSQLVNRMTTQLEEHGGFPGYYPVSTLAMFYPWSAIVPASIVAAWSRRKQSPALGFLLGWALGPLVPLELMKTKLIHYYFPAMPALAILVAWFITVVAADVVTIRRWTFGRLAMGLIGGMGIGIVVLLIAGVQLLPGPVRLPSVALAVIVAAGTLYALFLFQSAMPVRAMQTLIVCWALAMAIFGGWFVPSGEPYRLSRIVGEKMAAYARAERTKPVLVTFQEPNIIYAMQRTAPTMRKWDQMADLLTRGQNLVTVINPSQVKSLDEDGRFQVDILEPVEGFNINKGIHERLRIARISPKSGVSLARRSAAEQTLVK